MHQLRSDSAMPASFDAHCLARVVRPRRILFKPTLYPLARQRKANMLSSCAVTPTAGTSPPVRATGPGQIVLLPDHARTQQPMPLRHQSDTPCAAQSTCDGCRRNP